MYNIVNYQALFTVNKTFTITENYVLSKEYV